MASRQRPGADPAAVPRLYDPKTGSLVPVVGARREPGRTPQRPRHSSRTYSPKGSPVAPPDNTLGPTQKDGRRRRTTLTAERSPSGTGIPVPMVHLRQTSATPTRPRLLPLDHRQTLDNPSSSVCVDTTSPRPSGVLFIPTSKSQQGVKSFATSSRARYSATESSVRGPQGTLKNSPSPLTPKATLPTKESRPRRTLRDRPGASLLHPEQQRHSVRLFTPHLGVNEENIRSITLPTHAPLVFSAVGAAGVGKTTLLTLLHDLDPIAGECRPPLTSTQDVNLTVTPVERFFLIDTLPLGHPICWERAYRPAFQALKKDTTHWLNWQYHQLVTFLTNVSDVLLVALDGRALNQPAQACSPNALELAPGDCDVLQLVARSLVFYHSDRQAIVQNLTHRTALYQRQSAQYAPRVCVVVNRSPAWLEDSSTYSVLCDSVLHWLKRGVETLSPELQSVVEPTLVTTTNTSTLTSTWNNPPFPSKHQTVIQFGDISITLYLLPDDNLRFEPPKNTTTHLQPDSSASFYDPFANSHDVDAMYAQPFSTACQTLRFHLLDQAKQATLKALATAKGPGDDGVQLSSTNPTQCSERAWLGLCSASWETIRRSDILKDTFL
ncbi:hypothetical protein IWQ62_002420 [Dispira parvispora]|uniref:Uncharacterized protein n=1 Tax=Dispira parvispora TaxID=1520584 RepID=A0A9W8AQ15_9FUNG|nr:hypothetical protein IWQ62_002420 [Dispira parvispora]